MTVYILEIPGSGFTGFMGGVDFYRGKGSTSSKADADLLVSKFGCLIIEPGSETKEAGAGLPAPAIIPEEVLESPGSPVYASKADRRHRERVEKIFEPKKKGKS